MSKASIGDQFVAEMTGGHEAEATSKGHVTRKISDESPDGLENLRSAYQEFWAETHHSTKATTADDPGLENSSVRIEPETERQKESAEFDRYCAAQSKTVVLKPRGRRRLGLPEGFVPRLQRFGPGVLLELNVYRLPNGQEFIPSRPTGPLGSRHLYALLTGEQYLGGRRGSVYVRRDRRIFDYSVVSANPLGDMFDTGYTIYDLERTGRYAPNAEAPRQTVGIVRRLKRQGKKKTQPTKSRRAATAG